MTRTSEDVLARVLEGLNDAQRAAVQAARGPVCILAGAGTGKTTTITRRIAYQIASRAFRAADILAVTFTERAAAEMRERLEHLGVGRVRARTFHAQALAQVAHFDGSPELLASKAQIIAPIMRSLPPPHRFKPTKDVAAEIERAKNRRIPAERYLDELGDHAPPLPADIMERVYLGYEERKQRAGLLDFEDLLERAIVQATERTDVIEEIGRRFQAFTVDEYQDVNLLQQTLLDAWLQGRRDVCVVGDDYQSIFGFTAATPRYLLEFGRRYRDAQVVTLTDNHRSSPQVLEVANRLVPHLQGTRKTLRATRPDGPEVGFCEYATGSDEVEAIVSRIAGLRDGGLDLEEIAVLYRVNARSEDFEEALAAARIPFQVRDGAFLRRAGPRAVLARLRRAKASAPAYDATVAAARAVGWDPDTEADGEEELNRQADLGRLVHIAAELQEATGTATVADLLADVHRRFSDEQGARGVVLSTYHRAKGLEWDAVFMPRLEERELPFALSRGADDLAEERRLLYVGITRARRQLWISWAATRDSRTAQPSRFVDEILPRRSAAATLAASPPVGSDATPVDAELFARLRTWRALTAREAGVPAYVVFHDATLRAICDQRPNSLRQLASIPGIGPTKLARYGGDVLRVVKESPVSTPGPSS